MVHPAYRCAHAGYLLEQAARLARRPWQAVIVLHVAGLDRHAPATEFAVEKVHGGLLLWRGFFLHGRRRKVIGKARDY
jgi:hypothetical protein